MAAKASLSSLINKARFSTEAGFTLVEIIIATALFLIIVPSLITTLWASETAAVNAKYHQEALDRAQLALDNIKLQNFRDINSSTTNDDFYQTTLTAARLNLYTKQVEVSVSWQVPSLPEQEVVLTTQAVDALAARNGSTCLVTVDANDPMSLISSVDLGVGNEATGVAVRNDLAFVTANSTIASVEDFFVIDVTDVAQPVILARLNTGPGLSSITISGDNAFVGNTSINGQLQIIDLSNPSSPVLKKTYKLPGIYTDNTTIAHTLAYSDRKVFLGTQKSQIAEFHIVDVADVNVPTELGSFEVDAAVNNIAIVDNTAYIANPSGQEIKILDVSDPSNPQQVTVFDAPGGSGNGKSLAVMDNTLILGRTVGGQELYYLDITDPNQPQELSSRKLTTSLNSLAVSPPWLFIGTTDLTKTVQVWNNTDPTNPVFVKALALPERVTNLACGLDNIYATSANDLLIIAP